MIPNANNAKKLKNKILVLEIRLKDIISETWIHVRDTKKIRIFF